MKSLVHVEKPSICTMIASGELTVLREVFNLAWFASRESDVRDVDGFEIEMRSEC